MHVQQQPPGRSGRIDPAAPRLVEGALAADDSRPAERDLAAGEGRTVEGDPAAGGPRQREVAAVEGCTGEVDVVALPRIGAPPSEGSRRCRAMVLTMVSRTSLSLGRCS